MVVRVSLIVALSVGLGVVLAGLTLSRIRAGAAQDHRRIEELSAAIRELQRKRPTLVRVVERSPENPASFSPGEPGSPERDDAPEHAEKRAASSGDNAGPGMRPDLAMTTKLNLAFSAEATERAWADRSHDNIAATVASIGFERNVATLECRSALCKIESTFPGIDSYNKFSDEVGGRVPDGDGLVTPTPELRPDGSVHAVSYWVRRGQLAILFPPAPGAHAEPYKWSN
jgi:hypothetical protein